MTDIFLAKIADEVINSNVLQDDDIFTFNVTAGQRWTVDIYLFSTCAINGIDFQFRMVGPAGALIARYGAVGMSVPSTSAEADARIQALSNNVAIQTGVVQTGTIGENFVVISAYLDNTGGVDGTFKLQWAQINNDPANPVTLKAGSHLFANRVT